MTDSSAATGGGGVSGDGSARHLWGRVGLGLLLALALAAPLPYLDDFFLDLSAGDEGVHLMAAHRVLHGQVPYRDFFSILFPGVQWLLAGMFSLLDETLLTARLLWLAGNAVLVLATWALLRGLGASRAGQAAALAFLVAMGGAYWPILSHHWLCTAATMASAACIAAALERGRLIFLAGAGLAAGSGLLLSQDQGAAWLFLGVLPLLAGGRSGRLRSVAVYALSASAVLLPSFLYLALTGALPGLWDDTVRFPLAIYHVNPGNRVHWGQGWWSPVGFFGSGGWEARILALQRAGTDLAHALVLLLYPAGLVALGWGGLRLHRDPRQRAQLALLAALSGTCLVSVLHRPAILLLVFGAVGPLAVTVWVLEQRWPESRTLGRAFAASCVGLLALSLAMQWLPRAVVPGRTFQLPAGSVRAYAPGDMAALGLLARFGSEVLRPGERIFCYSYGSAFYFLLGRDNPARYDNFDVIRDDPARVRALLDQLAATPPDWVLLDGRYQDREADPVMAWVEPRYRVVAKSPRLVLARRAQIQGIDQKD